MEGNADSRRAGGHRGNAAQGEFGQAAAVGHQFAFALHHVDGHGGLAVFEGGELLGAGSRQGAVARNDFFSQSAVGFEAEREGGNIEQQPVVVALVAGQHVGLHGGAECNHLVGI